MIDTEDIFQGCNLQLIGDLEKDNKTQRIKLIYKDMIEKAFHLQTIASGQNVLRKNE